MRKNNTINILLWTCVIVCPFLLQGSLININDWMISQNNGIVSILTGTFLHASFKHMVGNLTNILLGATIIYQFYNKMYLWLVLLGIAIPSGLMYALGFNSVGISGLGYTLIWFIICRGLMSHDTIRFMIGLLALVFYGGSILGAIPSTALSTVAWQAHLMGMIVGFMAAMVNRLKT